MIILAIIPIAFFAELFLFLGNLNLGSKTVWTRLFLRAAIICGSYAIIILELLSLFSWVSPLSLSIAWFLPSLVLAIALFNIYRRSNTINFPTISIPSPWIIRVVLCLIGIVLLITFIVAWIAPPQTADSYVYHMSRVAHWAQNRSIRPYATGIRFQNTMSQAAEFIILHFYVMTGSDRLANLVQWFAMLGSLISVSLVASQLRAHRTGIFFAMAFMASLPMGIVQASSTMTDYVVTFWIICAVSEGLHLIQGYTHWADAFFLGSSVGLAIATKPTAFAFLLPFAILIPVNLFRKIKPVRFLFITILVLFCITVLNLGHFARNNALYGSPLGHEGTLSRHANEQINGKVILSNIIRHASLHAGTYWDGVNDWIYDQIVKIHVKIGQDINDPRTTFTEFRILKPNTQENIVTNPIHAYLIVLATILTFFLLSRVNSTTIIYGISVVLGFVAFSALFKYQIFGSRLQLPFFVLMAPFVGVIFTKIRIGKWMPLIGIILILLSFPWLFQISSRPIIPDQEAKMGSIFFQSREDMYFPGIEARNTSYMAITDRIKASNCSSVGLILSGSSSEYLWWVLLGAPRDDLQIEWIVSDSPTARYEDPDFEPCAIICENCPSEWTKIRGLPLVEGIDDSSYKLFLRQE
jgi:hypothetical protein